MGTQLDQKQKKGFMSSFFKSNTKNHHKSKSDPAPLTTVATKPILSQNLLLRKPKNCQELVNGGLMSTGLEKRGGEKIVEARKSVSHVETNLGSVAEFLQVKVLVADMPGFMQVQAFRCARRTYDSLEKFSSKHIAYNIKKEFDKVYGPAWHCIVGSSFGSFVTHSTELWSKLKKFVNDKKL